LSTKKYSDASVIYVVLNMKFVFRFGSLPDNVRMVFNSVDLRRAPACDDNETPRAKGLAAKLLWRTVLSSVLSQTTTQEK
jgi:hypothetical protein